MFKLILIQSLVCDPDDKYFRMLNVTMLMLISHKHRCEAALEKLDCLRKGGDRQVSGCTRLNYPVMLIFKNRDFFIHMLNNSDIFLQIRVDFFV